MTQDQGDAGVRLHVVDVGGLAEDAGLGGERRADPGHAPGVLDGRDEPGLLAADVAAGPAHHLHVEGEARSQDALAQEPPLAGLLDRLLHALHRQGILVADVDVAVGGAGGVAADDDPLDDEMGVALHEVAVNEGAGVSLVGIADHVLGGVLGGAQELPLAAGGEGGAAAPPQSGLRHLADDLLIGHAQGFGQPLVAAAGDVVVDLLRVDHAAVGHEAADLGAEELQRPQRRHAPPVGGQVVQRLLCEDGEGQLGSDPVGGDGLLDELRHPIGGHSAVEDGGPPRARHLHDGLPVAQPPAAGGHDVRLQGLS